MRRFRLGLVGLALLGATLVNGCWFNNGAAVGAAGATVAYSYQFNKLHANVENDVESTHRAVMLGLQDLNIYVIHETSDRISAHVEARNAAGKAIVIDESLLTPHMTQVTIHVGWGLTTAAKSQAEAIYAAMDKRLQSKQ
jgi:ribosome-associated translation inhibitor RaiA